MQNKIFWLHTVFFLFISCFSTKAMAWGPNGHRIIATIASKYLDEKSKKTITEIMGHNNLAKISTIPDELRDDNSAVFHWANCNNDKKCRPIIVKWQDSWTWHFANLDNNFNLVKKDPDIITKLKNAINILLSPSTTKRQKQSAIIWVTHLVADIHQPIHTGRMKDLGGNEIKIKFFQKDTDLHSLWDRGLIDYFSLSYTEYADFLLSPMPAKIIIHPPLGQLVDNWAEENIMQAKQVYAGVKEGDNIDKNYILQNKSLLNQRLTIAGLRLAALFNTVFKQ